jgi:hypothetical protein
MLSILIAFAPFRNFSIYGVVSLSLNISAVSKLIFKLAFLAQKLVIGNTLSVITDDSLPPPGYFADLNHPCF